MIFSSTTAAELSTEWSGVIRMRERMQKQVVGAFVGLHGVGLSSILYNLPLLLAFDMLKTALERARAEKLFDCQGRHPGLSKLMECAKDKLDWIDWNSLQEGVRRRNAIAHDGELYDSEQCLQDIENVEAQLVSWGVVN